jgi:H+/Cl- antiporter ClcA
MMKGFAAGVASSVAVVLLVAGVTPGHKALLWLLVLAVICAAGARWTSQHWASRRAALRQRPRATAAGDYRRLT